MKRAAVATAAVLSLCLAGCSGAHAPRPGVPEVLPSPTLPKDQATKTKPKYRVTFTTSCQDDWPVVFQTSPPRLVSEVRLRNRGTAATWVNVKTTWFYFGGGSTSKIAGPIRLQPGQRKRVAVSKPVSESVLMRMTGWKYGDRMCRTTGTNY